MSSARVLVLLFLALAIISVYSQRQFGRKLSKGYMNSKKIRNLNKFPHYRSKNENVDIRADERNPPKEVKGDENYMVLYDTKFAFKNVDEFGLEVKYNKTEHVHYGNKNKEDEQGAVQTRAQAQTQTQEQIQEQTHFFPYINKNGSWQIKNMTSAEVFPRAHIAWSASNLDVHYHLYTRANPEDFQEIHSKEDLKKSHFMDDKMVIFTIHGWLSGDDLTIAFTNMRRAYLKAGDYNVFVVDWPEQNVNLNYVVLADITQEIGRRIANFIRLLVREGGADINRIKIVGHSLGAHIAGYTGKNLGGRVSSIVGLDPVNFLFDPESYDKSLRKGDAKFVEIWHSSKVGVYHPIGDADIYFNGGNEQPSCFQPQCSHAVVNEYFIESITNTYGFEMEDCETLENLENDRCFPRKKYLNGIVPNTNAIGIFNVKTRSRQPYATNVRRKRIAAFLYKQHHK